MRRKMSKPEKSKRGDLRLTLEPSIMDELRRRAKAARRTIQAQATLEIERGLADSEKAA